MILRLGPIQELLLRGPARGVLPETALSWAAEQSVRLFSKRLVARLGDQHRVVVGTDTASHHLFQRLERERPDILRVLDISHPLDQVVQRLIREDATTFDLPIEAYDDYHGGRTFDYGRELELADLIIVASQFTAQSLAAQGVDMSKVVVIPYGVEQQTTTPHYRAPRERLELLALGAMSERKGVSLLLEAMEVLRQRHVPARLHLAGKEAGAFRLPDYVPDNVVVSVSPQREEVEDLYRQTDVLILPSMCEGFGRTILEALSHGCSVIATEASAAPDILAEHANAPIEIIQTQDRGRLADFLERYHAERDAKLRPAEARETAAAYTRDRYQSTLVAAIDAAAHRLENLGRWAG